MKIDTEAREIDFSVKYPQSPEFYAQRKGKTCAIYDQMN